MVYTSYLWYNWGWFSIALLTLSHIPKSNELASWFLLKLQSTGKRGPEMRPEAEKPRSQEARHKPRSWEAEKPRSREVRHKPRSREAEKPPDKPRSREAEAEKPRSRPRSRSEKPRSREAEEPPGKPRSREATEQAEKPRSHRTSWDSSPGIPSEHYVASSPSQDINSPTPSEPYVAPWDISPPPLNICCIFEDQPSDPLKNPTSPR